MRSHAGAWERGESGNCKFKEKGNKVEAKEYLENHDVNAMRDKSGKNVTAYYGLDEVKRHLKNFANMNNEKVTQNAIEKYLAIEEAPVSKERLCVLLTEFVPQTTKGGIFNETITITFGKLYLADKWDCRIAVGNKCFGRMVDDEEKNRMIDKKSFKDKLDFMLGQVIGLYRDNAEELDK